MGKRIENILIQKGLSNKEAAIASLVADGFSNQEIADDLGLEVANIQYSHLPAIYEKMHVKSRAQLVVAILPFILEEEKLEKIRARQFNKDYSHLPDMAFLAMAEEMDINLDHLAESF